jgi:hypothetical protein
VKGGIEQSLLLSLFLFSAGACGGPPANAPSGPHADLPKLHGEAFRADAAGDAGGAVRGYLEVVRAAAASDGDPWQIPALQASLDALTTRTLPSLGEAAGDAGLVWRTAERARVEAELARDADEARGPFARGLIARSLAIVAHREGDAARAETWRTANGCAREALVVGPTTWAPVTGVDDASPLDRADARIEPSYASGDAFGTTTAPAVARGHGCAIDLAAASVRPGVRSVVVDLRVDRPQTIGVALRAHGAAVLRVGGALAVRRPFELGDGEAARFARVSVTAGVVRVVARVGTAKEDDAVEIDAWGQDGRPLVASAPAVGSVATARAAGVETVEPYPCDGASAASSPRGPHEGWDDPKLLAAAASLASGDAREAERMLWGAATRSDAKPEIALVYARGVDVARDLSPATRAERARTAYERVLEAWPGEWEATIAHAVLAGVRRGRGEAGVETLRDLDGLRAKGSAAGPEGVRPQTGPSGASASAPALLDAFEAIVSGREHLFDRAQAALERARAPLAGTALFADADAAATPRLGAGLVASVCDPARASAHDTLACFDALRASGDHAAAMRELARVRAVLGAPSKFLSLELRDRLASGDTAGANQAFGAMTPGERTLSALALLDQAQGHGTARDHLLQLAATARDAPLAIAPLLRAAGDDPTSEFEGVAEKLAAQDRAAPVLPNAATAVLTHVERYDVQPTGLVRWLLFDVRRVSGTTDVEENAQADPPAVWGRGSSRALRRRILKHDGRVVEPDRTPNAAQAHADLEQLEKGDVVEAVYEGWALPGDTGDIGIDTPDMLPERVGVHDGTIQLRLPKGLRGSLWSHPLLGKPEERADGDARVLSWHVVDRPSRRIEGGVPKMDRNAAVSFSTAQWTDVARALRETLASLDDHDPEIATWARNAAGAGADSPAGADAPKPTRAAVEALVIATGKALREADAGTLSDYGGGIAAVQTETARSFLTSHDGSRSWLVLRGLRELGVASEVVVAESDPFSADPAFPPHFGRFTHPLVVAHLDGQDVWIDADVAGPPLPAGRVSPELRGRLALHGDGSIAPLPAIGADKPGGAKCAGANCGAGEERDEVDVRLTLDAKGDARGTFAVVLRGRNAQELAEALFRIVGVERQRALRDVVLGWLPWANVDDVQLASSEGSWQVSLRADVSVSGYAQLEQGKTWLLPGLDTMHWSWPRARVSSLAATFATRAGRESALALNMAVQYHVHRRVELPPGASVARMPGPLDVKAKLVEASRKIAVTGGALEDDFVLGVTTGTIATSDYDAFVGVAHAADDGFLASTRVNMP